MTPRCEWVNVTHGEKHFEWSLTAERHRINSDNLMRFNYILIYFGAKSRESRILSASHLACVFLRAQGSAVSNPVWLNTSPSTSRVSPAHSQPFTTTLHTHSFFASPALLNDTTVPWQVSRTEPKKHSVKWEVACMNTSLKKLQTAISHAKKIATAVVHLTRILFIFL